MAKITKFISLLITKVPETWDRKLHLVPGWCHGRRFLSGNAFFAKNTQNAGAKGFCDFLQ
jgi:hypothetical protein